MSNRTTVVFKKSLLAAAVLSLSACSTVPQIEDYDLSKVGAGILKAGRATADMSEHVWGRTTYLLGFSDVDVSGGSEVSDGTLLMDDVDIALAQEDALMPDAATLRPISIPKIKATRLELPEGNETAIADEVNEPNLVLGSIDESSTDTLPVEDLVHEVARAETLWDIAKKITGDANNWHVLADVNNLSQSASVFPGQQLIIPADMVKPDFFDTGESAPENTQQAATEISVEKQNVASQAPTSGTPLTIAAGESLWDFAKRTTGDATNWKLIASHNNFSERQSTLVRAGQTILVPENLVAPEQSSVAVADASSQPLVDTQNQQDSILATADTSLTNPANTLDEQAVSASSELLAEASSLDETSPVADETQAITIVEATFKTEPSTMPLVDDASTAIAAPGIAAENERQQIMVSGTYYPKAIYNEADFSSSLLMRVSPGTTLQVSRVQDGWYQVETDKGVGYVHQRDIK